MTTTDIEKRSPRLPATKETLAGLDQIVLGGPYPVELNSTEQAGAIAMRILQADSFDEVFSQGEDGLPDWPMDVPVKILGFHMNRSTFYDEKRKDNEALSGYAVVDLVTSDGEMLTVACGARNVVAQLRQILAHDWWDKTYKLISKDTSSGYSAYWLVPA